MMQSDLISIIFPVCSSMRRLDAPADASGAAAVDRHLAVEDQAAVVVLVVEGRLDLLLALDPDQIAGPQVELRYGVAPFSTGADR